MRSTSQTTQRGFSLIEVLIAIAIAGMFLGDATADVVEQLGVHPAIAGWILGVVTSIPEMVSFFAVYGAANREGKLRDLNDTQEALDNPPPIESISPATG